MRGSPNTYKKIVKGCKKISMGLCSEQRSPGTTVILREFFHNLPVRRKSILSSLRKVLQGIKERIIRLALIHPDVSFSVFDLERCEKLVHTRPCVSSLDTLSELFGSWICPQMQETSLEKENLKLHGFVSKKSSRFPLTKAIQFLYLNGRFVQKTPVHKLVNTYFSVNCGSIQADNIVRDLPLSEMNSWMLEAPSSRMYPAFLMELKCPLSWYDITFEASKTSVEFKNWGPVLSFVTGALEIVWGKPLKTSEGEATHSAQNGGVDLKKRMPRKRKPWQLLDPTYHPCANIKDLILEEETPYLSDAVDNLRRGNEDDSNCQMPKGRRTPRKRKSYGSFFLDQGKANKPSGHGDLQCCTEKEATRDIPLRSMRERKHILHLGDSNLLIEKTSLENSCIGPFFKDMHEVSRTGRSLEKYILHEDELLKPLPSLPVLSTVHSPLRLKWSSSQMSTKDMLLDLQHPIDEVNESSYMEGSEMSGHDQVSPMRRETSSGVRRCLYKLDLKPMHMDDFFCHSERKTVSNFNLIYGADVEDPFDNLVQKSPECTNTFSNNFHLEHVWRDCGRYMPRGTGRSQEESMKGIESKLALCSNVHGIRNLGCKATPSKFLAFNEIGNRRDAVDKAQAFEHRSISFQRNRLTRTFSGPPFSKPRQKYAVYSASTSFASKNCNGRTSPTKGLPSTIARERHENLPAALEYSHDGKNLHCSPFAESCPQEVTAMQLYKEWKNPCMRSNEQSVLNLSSASLGPHNKHLVPDSISKDALRNARVLQQMGKKFIGTVAQDTLVVIDQHAADERVRLEQLRIEVLEDKKHLSTLLDYPEELCIAMEDIELLNTFKCQIEDWGWRFKVFPKGNTFNGTRDRKVHVGNAVALVTAVPNILGESLTNSSDLLEYLRQLAKTDGTSAPPPALFKILASKACRGAIMFGDFLLRSECQQLVEALKRTALSFQCAHGRPTIVPLVNLEVLRRRLCRLHSTGPNGLGEWHGLQWHRPTLERAKGRLKSAKGM